MDRSDAAVNKFKEGYNCAQSVIFSYADKLNISGDLALRLSNGFGGGMGRKQEVCGAVSGAIIVLGLIYGRGENEDKAKQDKTYSKVRELIDAFNKQYATINCSRLLNGCELLTSDGQERFKSQKMIEKCYEYVACAVKILDEIIDE